MKTGSIQQTIAFKVPASKIYELIMDENLHSEITGGEVKMGRNIKDSFTIFDGYCTGYNIELIPGEKIVQAWHFEEEGWPKDHYSICTFNLKNLDDGCLLEFTQTDIPQNNIEALKEGWQTYYWEPMQEYTELDLDF
jgi:activator of HSP90 ATPase